MEPIRILIADDVGNMARQLRRPIVTPSELAQICLLGGERRRQLQFSLVSNPK